MYKIAVIAGDGTGPEVINEAVKVLKAVESDAISFELTDLNYNGTRYLETGVTLTDEELENLKTYDAILLGAIGHVDVTPGILERDILLKTRFGLDQYINLRPVKLYPNVYTPIKNKTDQDIDYVVVRENTGGLYTGHGKFEDHGTENEVAVQEMIYTRKQVERCVKYAFQTVVNRHQEVPWKGLSESETQNGKIGKLTLCGKTNVLTYVFDLWQRVVNEMAKDFPSVVLDYVHVDAACIYMVESPERFDVIVTNNMFGDIITDLAAVTQGGMGVAAGGNINPEGVSMFEPIGGTAPSFTGLNQINPMAAIGAVHMMLDHLGHSDVATKIEVAKKAVIQKMNSMQAAQMGYSTTELGDMVVEELNTV
ncbi:3-isopropylmalate dehydrogenase [Candidatus Marinamargulisbacteria bacterium SCGC AAA071-K20]|nr:3-isopropylmalate dehydrogenase [Candidatus Marinamargulisbacteria bacterium SCGC AAA071-K20]